MTYLRNLIPAVTLFVLAATPLTLSAKDGPSSIEKKYHELGFSNNTVAQGDKKAANALEKKCNRVRLVTAAAPTRSSVMTAGGDPIVRPDSPYLEIDPDKVEGYAGYNIDDDTKRAIRALGLEYRLKLTDPLSYRLRVALRKRDQPPLDSRASALVYDDGSTKQSMFTEGFENYFQFLGQHERKGLFHLNNPYKCELGNHASAVTATLLQACPSIQYPITVIGGDGKKGDFSDGPSIDDTWTKALMSDLANDAIRHQKLFNPVVFNASYGYDAKGDFGDTLDEGGVWKTFWDEVAGSVVVQAAGNESTNLTVSDKALAADKAYETAHNMEFTFNNRDYQGQLIHAIASLPDFDTGANTLAVSFSNYYSKLDTKFVHFARDHSMMAPGEYVFVPMDPFDADGDGRFHVDADQLNEWSGTSAASPMITGAILRLVNEFGLTAHQAAAVLLETADHVYERKVKGELKSMNLGAALQECVKQDIYREIAQPYNNYYQFSTSIMPTYFDDKKGDLTLEERNFLFDIADRCGHVYVMSEDKKANYRTLKNWKRKNIKRGTFMNDHFYYKRAKNNVLSAYCFIDDTSWSYLKTIEAEDSGDPRVAQFRLTYTGSVEKPSVDEFAVKGVLDTEIEVFEIESTDKEYVVHVRIPENFTSERVLSLHVPGQLILGKQDNRMKFDGKKFVL